MPRQITSSTTLEHLKREAKRWLRALQSNDAAALARLYYVLPHAPVPPTLRDVQHALALEFGLPGWTALKNRLAPGATMRRYDEVAAAVVTAYHSGDPAAMRIVWDHAGHMRAWEPMRRYMRLALGRREVPETPDDDVFTLADARFLVARGQGFDNWDALVAFASFVPAGAPGFAVRPVSVYAAAMGEANDNPSLDDERPIASRSRNWDEVIALIQEQRLPGLGASGQMTDALLERITRIEHLTVLDLEQSPALTDDGIRHLARLPGLRHLNLSGCPITDRGLEVLRHLPALETLTVAWTPITDAGAIHLGACTALRRVDLGGTACGDGAIRALAGTPHLWELRSGTGVTDAGLARLHDLPVFKTWHGGAARMALLSPDARPNLLMLRGSFTDAGMAQLAGLDGLYALNIDDSRLAVTGAGLAPLAALPHLGWLAFDAKDDAMAPIAALPHLRFLMCQDTTAGDDGFVALSRSQSIEHIWGRRCHNLRRRGFVALADMPALRHLSVSCKNVDDEGVSALPRFPSLRELMPMDVPDAGYRHIGRCEHLESLVLMYCRDTGDGATEHLATLPALRKYFASYNLITDRTPQILAGMPSLESVTFDSCAGLTNAGVAVLARLPRLRELRVGGIPRVTAEIATAFSPGVALIHHL